MVAARRQVFKKIHIFFKTRGYYVNIIILGNQVESGVDRGGGVECGERGG